MNTEAASTAPVATPIAAAVAAALNTNKPSFGDIPLACIRASKTNPRKIFNETDLQDLANSIKVQGVAQPILVRPVEVVDGITYFEIVAGERRFRASAIAGMATVPAIVRELSDQAAYEIQVLENLQRVDLHPLEEAEGFEVMMAQYKVSAEQLAEKTGKSKAYIYASLKLCDLQPKARKAFYDGLLTKSTALLVARIPVKALQLKCMEDITGHWGGPMSTREAAQHIEARYTLNLKKASFKLADGELCPQAGPCTSCPKRAGNQPEVFSDINADVCTDPDCFKAKGDAHVIRIKQLATASGQTVFSGAEAKKIMPNNYGEMKGYIDLDKPNYADPKSRTWRQILGKELPPVALLESPHTSTLYEIVKSADVETLLQAKGIKAPASSDAGYEKAREREREQERKSKIEREYRTQLFTAIHHSTLMVNLVDIDLRLIACQLFDNLPNNTTPKTLVTGLHGWSEETIGYPDRAAKLRAAVDALTPAQLNQFIRDCVLCRELEVNVYTATKDDKPDNLLAFAARAKVDAKKIRADIDAEAKAKQDAKKKAAEKKSAKAAAVPTAPKGSKASPPTKTKPATKSKPKSVPVTPDAAMANPTPEPAAKDAPPADAFKNSAWPFPTSSRPRTTAVIPKQPTTTEQA